ncbi:MAG: ferrous iron transport protein B [Candidatus Omnitrophota bacterium]
MHVCANKTEIDLKDKRPLILVGGTNVGKSVIFGLLTSQYVTVSNYPGTTVEVASAVSGFGRHKYLVLDTPGINSLVPYSEDENVTRDIIFRYPDKIILHIFDTKNFANNLMFTLQLIETGAPLVVALNMFDEAGDRGINVDVAALAGELGLGVVATVAVEKRGMRSLLDEIPRARPSGLRVDYGENIEQGLGEICRLLPDIPVSKRLAGILLLSEDKTFGDYLVGCGAGRDVLDKIGDVIGRTQEHFARPLPAVIIAHRHRIAREIFGRVCRMSRDSSLRRSRRGPIPRSRGSRRQLFLDGVGRLMVSPLWGLLIAAGAMYLVYLFVGQFGAGVLVDFIEKRFFQQWFNPGFAYVLDFLSTPVFLRDLLVGEYGLVTMAVTYSFAIILPIVTTFFIAFGILEDTGYLPRLAAVVNRMFKIVGLHGKAVLPFVLGLGCGTMAVLTTRILETKKERLLAILLLALVIPCSAQLGVILGMLSFISGKMVLIWLMILLFILAAVGFCAARIIPGEVSDFMIELPPVRLPQLSNILIKVRARLFWYLKEAVPLFVLGTLLLFVLDKTNLLLRVEEFFSPIVVNFLGLPQKATQAFIIGFLRRDYGAAGLYALQQKGLLTNIQALVSILTITLFVPCVAQFFVIIKEQGLKRALLISAFVMAFAVIVGGAVNFFFRCLT